MDLARARVSGNGLAAVAAGLMLRLPLLLLLLLPGCCWTVAARRLLRSGVAARATPLPRCRWYYAMTWHCCGCCWLSFGSALVYTLLDEVQTYRIKWSARGEMLMLLTQPLLLQILLLLLRAPVSAPQGYAGPVDKR